MSEWEQKAWQKLFERGKGYCSALIDRFDLSKESKKDIYDKCLSEWLALSPEKRLEIQARCEIESADPESQRKCVIDKTIETSAELKALIYKGIHDECEAGSKFAPDEATARDFRRWCNEQIPRSVQVKFLVPIDESSGKGAEERAVGDSFRLGWSLTHDLPIDIPRNLLQRMKKLIMAPKKVKIDIQRIHPLDLGDFLKIKQQSKIPEFISTRREPVKRESVERELEQGFLITQDSNGRIIPSRTVDGTVVSFDLNPVVGEIDWNSVHYLGTFHTHPIHVPVPTIIDLGLFIHADMIAIGGFLNGDPVVIFYVLRDFMSRVLLLDHRVHQYLRSLYPEPSDGYFIELSESISHSPIFSGIGLFPVLIFDEVDERRSRMGVLKNIANYLDVNIINLKTWEIIPVTGEGPKFGAPTKIPTLPVEYQPSPIKTDIRLPVEYAPSPLELGDVSLTSSSTLMQSFKSEFRDPINAQVRAHFEQGLLSDKQIADLFPEYTEQDICILRGCWYEGKSAQFQVAKREIPVEKLMENIEKIHKLFEETGFNDGEIASLYPSFTEREIRSLRRAWLRPAMSEPLKSKRASRESKTISDEDEEFVTILFEKGARSARSISYLTKIPLYTVNRIVKKLELRRSSTIGDEIRAEFESGILTDAQIAEKFPQFIEGDINQMRVNWQKLTVVKKVPLKKTLEEWVIALYKGGYSVPMIAKELGALPTKIEELLAAKSPYFRVLQLHRKGLRAFEIARIMEIPIGRVHSYLQSEGVGIRFRAGDNPKFLIPIGEGKKFETQEQKVSYIIERLKDGYPLEYIADQAGVDRTFIEEVLRDIQEGKFRGVSAEEVTSYAEDPFQEWKSPKNLVKVTVLQFKDFIRLRWDEKKVRYAVLEAVRGVPELQNITVLAPSSKSAIIRFEPQDREKIVGALTKAGFNVSGKVYKYNW